MLRTRKSRDGALELRALGPRPDSKNRASAFSSSTDRRSSRRSLDSSLSSTALRKTATAIPPTPVCSKTQGPLTRSRSSELRRQSAPTAAARTTTATRSETACPTPEPVLAADLVREWKQHPDLYIVVSAAPVTSRSRMSWQQPSAALCRSVSECWCPPNVWLLSLLT